MNRNYLVFKSQLGLTLVELMVVVVVSGVVLGGVIKLFISSNEIYNVQENVVRIQQDIRSGLDSMAKNIRMAGLDPSGDADCAGIVTANSTTLHVRGDYNSDGDCSDDNTDIDRKYFYNSSGNKLTVNGSSRGIDNIVSMSFSYFDGDGNTVAANSDIRMVKVSICGQMDESEPYSDKYNGTYCFNNTVTCRNMGI